jgi:hypothetical protein
MCSTAQSLQVRVGSMCDPQELPGLAHFCEHMLFYSSEKYPVEDEYSRCGKQQRRVACRGCDLEESLGNMSCALSCSWHSVQSQLALSAAIVRPSTQELQPAVVTSVPPLFWLQVHLRPWWPHQCLHSSRGHKLPGATAAHHCHSQPASQPASKQASKPERQPGSLTDTHTQTPKQRYQQRQQPQQRQHLQRHAVGAASGSWLSLSHA